MGPTEQLARRRARSSSVAEKAFTSCDDTDSTPMVAPSDISGSTTRDAMENPCAGIGTKRASLRTSTRRTGSPWASTHPEIPTPALSGTDGASCAIPERALARSCERDASSRRIEA